MIDGDLPPLYHCPSIFPLSYLYQYVFSPSFLVLSTKESLFFSISYFQIELYSELWVDMKFLETVFNPLQVVFSVLMVFEYLKHWYSMK